MQLKTGDLIYLKKIISSKYKNLEGQFEVVGIDSDTIEIRGLENEQYTLNKQRFDMIIFNLLTSNGVQFDRMMASPVYLGKRFWKKMTIVTLLAFATLIGLIYIAQTVPMICFFANIIGFVQGAIWYRARVKLKQEINYLIPKEWMNNS